MVYRDAAASAAAECYAVRFCLALGRSEIRASLANVRSASFTARVSGKTSATSIKQHHVRPLRKTRCRQTQYGVGKVILGSHGIDVRRRLLQPDLSFLHILVVLAEMPAEH
jgi:hypothetical protein